MAQAKYTRATQECRGSNGIINTLKHSTSLFLDALLNQSYTYPSGYVQGDLTLEYVISVHRNFAKETHSNLQSIQKRNVLHINSDEMY